MASFKEFFNQRNYSDDEIIAMYLNQPGKRMSEIAHDSGKNVQELYRILRENGVKPNRLKVNHANVLSFTASGLPVEEVAELTGYSPRNVKKIIRRWG